MCFAERNRELEDINLPVADGSRGIGECAAGCSFAAGRPNFSANQSAPIYESAATHEQISIYQPIRIHQSAPVHESRAVDEQISVHKSFPVYKSSTIWSHECADAYQSAGAPIY
jgi:hypothetical protein